MKRGIRGLVNEMVVREEMITMGLAVLREVLVMQIWDYMGCDKGGGVCDWLGSPESMCW